MKKAIQQILEFKTVDSLIEKEVFTTLLSGLMYVFTVFFFMFIILSI